MMKTENLHLSAEWDKTFPKNDQVDHQKITFVNRYGITLAADPARRIRPAARHRRQRTVWRSKRTILRFVRADARRIWLCDPRL